MIKFKLKQLLFSGILLEVLLLGVCYLISSYDLKEAFRYAARYSGRISALVFILTFYQYTISLRSFEKAKEYALNLITLFAVLHVIHFFFLAANIYLNAVALVPVKLSGGALAYLMIVLAPFYFYKIRLPYQLIYFSYVTLVMVITYVARIKGDFEGAEPSWVHYAMITVLIISFLVFGIKIKKAIKS